MPIFGSVGAPQTIGAANGGKVYAYNNLTTTPTVVAAANSARVEITFHNPGTSDVFIAPVMVQTNGSSVPLLPTTSALGGCFRVYANGGSLVINGECQGAWQAFSNTGSGNPLTVVDSNVG